MSTSGRLAHTNDISAKQAAISLAVILTLGLAVRMAVTLARPLGLNSFSDDNAYISSAADFVKTGYITYSNHEKQSGVLGVGMPLLLGLLFQVFGYQPSGMLTSHILFSAIGLVTAYGAYLWGARLHSRKAGVLAAALVALDGGMIIANCSFYVETPYLCANLFALYFFTSCIKAWSPARYAVGIACFCIAASFKGLACLVLPYAVVLALALRVPARKWLPRVLAAMAAFALIFLPWCVRNLSVTGSFTPFPISQGDQKLLGAFEGFDHPEGDYNTASMLMDREAWEQGYQDDATRRLRRRGEYADELYATWFREQPVGFVFTHAVYKPLKLLAGIATNRSVIPIPERLVRAIWYACLAFSALGMLMDNQKRDGQFWALPLYLAGAALITAIYIPLARYNQPHVPILYIYTAIGILECINRLKAKRRILHGCALQARSFFI